jgi:hypothetical protein
MEHRWGQRMPCRALVRVSERDGIGGSGRVRDVSSSGAFIETSSRFAVNARLALVVLGNESATHPVEIAAIVVRVGRDGIGVEWCDTPAGAICSVLGCIKSCTALAVPVAER